MRLRMNGPKTLEEFNAGKYSKSWLNAGHLRTDSAVNKEQKRISLLDTGDGNEEEEEEDREYMDGSTLF